MGVCTAVDLGEEKGRKTPIRQSKAIQTIGNDIEGEDGTKIKQSYGT